MTRSDEAWRQPFPPNAPPATRAPGAGSRILVLTPQLPYPPHQGTTIRNYNLIAGLARNHRVDLISFGDPAGGLRTPLHDLCQSVQVIRPPVRTQADRIRGLLLSRAPDMALRLPSAEFEAALAAALQTQPPDIVEVEGIELAQYLLQAARERAGARRPLLVFDAHNAEYLLQRRAFETDARSRHPRRWAGAAYSFVQWRRLRAYERLACRTADRVVAVSEADAHALRQLVPGLRPAVVPNGVDIAFYTSPAPVPGGVELPGDSDLVFTGKMDFRPNVDAVLWFAQQVLPLVQRQMPHARFWVVGKDPHPRLAPLARLDGVRLTGRVEDVRPYIAGSALYVIPLRIGGGTRLKVLEAMAMGKAIVSTTLGCEGFELADGREVALADTPSAFAAVVLALLRSPEHRQRLGRAARSWAALRYDWHQIVPLLEEVYRT